METHGKLDDELFAKLIQIAPLVAIDIVVRDSEGKVLLARRRDEPAKNSYFVPGGRIWKNETLRSAFERILKSEIGYDAKLDSARLIGAYDHIYPNNRFGQSGYGTHYVVLAYELVLQGNISIDLDANHASYQWLDEASLMRMPDVHPFVKAYFQG
jgi:colanic acid biosynthesis protein WcaH